MTPRQLEILQHALGCDAYGKTRHPSVPAHPDHFPYHRNRFCAGSGDETECRALVEMGLIQQHATTKWLPYFNCSATPAGIKAMREASPAPPKLTRGKQRYERFLDWSAATGGTFRDFLRYEGAAR